MAKIRDLLDSIEQDIHAVRVDGAQKRLEALIGELGADDVRQWQGEILRVIDSFHAKRKRSLADTFQARQNKLKLLPAEEKAPSEVGASILDQVALRERLESELARLAQFHIFQWSTYYREWAENFLEDQLRPQGRLAGNDVRSLIGNHITEIFERGFRYKTEDQHKAETLAHLTAVNGLQRFCELAVEFYAGAAMKLTRSDERQALRASVSSYLGAALIGFAKAQFGARTGAELLAAHPILWFHYLPFMQLEEFAYLTECLELGRVSLYLSELGRPLACVLDSACAYQGSSYLPQISQYFHDQRKLEILLHSPKATDGAGRIEIFVLLDSDITEAPHLKQAELRGVKLVIAALRPDVASAPIAERLQHVLVNVRESGLTSAQTDGRAISVLMDALSRLQPNSSSDALLEYNFARTFPLNNPFQSKYFHVVRGSVRNLLRELEGVNGVKLWCSVRRSGKTTACFDLSGALPSSDVVVQTCDTTRLDDLSSRLFDSIVEHLESSQPLPKTFIRNIVEELRPGGSPKARVVVILDEYETLFGRLRAASRVDPDLKFTVIYPLLGQMVAFAQENMLVFVGQQPNAHFILMEQNPLSAYVKQDSFPLFSHHKNSRNDEFSELVSKVLTEKYAYTNRFLDHLFAETGGHPFLTVNVLVSCVEWMISCGTRRSGVKFDEHLWDQFSSSELTSARLAINTEFQFFIEAASEAMSDDGLRSSPWLWAVYRSLREFSLKFGASGKITTDDFLSMYRFNKLDRSGVYGEEVLRTGADTNFLMVDGDGRVSVRIPVLAKIAAASVPRIS
jgi:hypothetical protein